ncbi:MAG: sensor histidine kinase [Microcystis wesenbergii Mw_QC_S_20081001_S30D]|jgi:signal transduction histidine kinase|uniref:Circadian input-output histidine kinase CikA n=1 Tax=Microcystis wesenbergii Mw_QC_S_20081001_S30D TaxID=2486245 RepID=A0A552JG28_9CHRO|nr:sensor histidine kinase [Microcystis aeruginosa W11-03]NCR94901.1 sensor histidine kinase [Microcystis aeruginosa W11-06]TRU94688.1 MAG: sensor histidine kinase [Microcystis wesenbergii Mw_QC_S_20081001_S30D]TRU95311.1 MAG: sensor histidine kinase [Microcystis wesenbergii Mw_QC_S_20081001_S30]TRV02440.1 MAG: sensor histidine kinase [Microcystis wesenbergii Mw_QC_B_20070930_S4D]TRV11720.1 MAG: sensor histidine kinase [Microcystis wesenbergii Mw_QC_B_20070930_S4]
MSIGQSSFRRILLSRLLLVSVPVLLMGVYVTYRKARSAFLETARQNLAESAIRKADNIEQSIQLLQANLITAGESLVLKQGNLAEKEAFLQQFTAPLPNHINCVELIDIKTKKPLLNRACEPEMLKVLPLERWAEKRTSFAGNIENILVRSLPRKFLIKSPNNNRQLELVFAVPIYNNQGQLQSSLILQTSLLYGEKVLPGSLSGYPVVISENGIILAHPYFHRIGKHISQEADAERLNSIISNAIRGKQNFLHLFSFEKDGKELVAGYSSLPSPVTGESSQQWVVLAISPLPQALAPLQQIWEAIFYLISGLLLAYLVAIVLIARDLARPLEKLRDYALNIQKIPSQKIRPQNFNIREINQLASALEEMLERLRLGGEEIVKSWQEAENANQLKNQFLANTSHELRTPLNGIIGSIRCVMDGFCNSEEEEKEYLQQADKAAVHLLEIIDDILSIAKIEAGKLSVNPEPVDLHQIINEVINLQTASLQRKCLKFNLLLCPENPIVYADPTKLKQVILNVISNSIKFTDRGTISLITHLEHPQAIMTIIDTGIGIDPRQQSKLFRPFVMIDGSTTRKFSGTGLGLAISKNFMKMMGGDITISSQGQGLGTTVEIILPLVGEKKLDSTPEENSSLPILPSLKS